MDSDQLVRVTMWAALGAALAQLELDQEILPEWRDIVRQWGHRFLDDRQADAKTRSELNQVLDDFFEYVDRLNADPGNPPLD